MRQIPLKVIGISYIGESIDIKTLSLLQVEDFILFESEKNLSAATISTYVRNIRIFLQWIHKEQGLSFEPSKIKIPKSPKKNVRILSETEILYLLESVKSSVSWITSRNRSIIALMLDSGLRQKEVCSLTKQEIDFSRNILKVTGKGAKDRFVSLGFVSRSFLRLFKSMSLSECRICLLRSFWMSDYTKFH